MACLVVECRRALGENGGTEGRARMHDPNEEVVVTWPPHFPDKCPPADAPAASGVVYRFVRQDPPRTEDFVSRQENQPQHHFGTKSCQASGLSVFRHPSDLDRLRRRVRAYETSLVATAELTSSHGVVLPTPTRNGTSHHTWWVPLGVVPASLFRVVPSSDSRT